MKKLLKFTLVVWLIMGCDGPQEEPGQGIEILDDERVLVYIMNLGPFIFENEAAMMILSRLDEKGILHDPDLWVRGSFMKETWDDPYIIHKEIMHPDEVDDADMDSTYVYSLSFSVSREMMKYYRLFLETDDKEYLGKVVHTFDPKEIGMALYGNRREFKSITQ